jgi:hypothetical protein
VKRLVSTLLFILLVLSAKSQGLSIQSVLVGSNNQPADMATIVLLHAKDSTYVGSTISDSLGRFRIEGLVSGKYIIQVQHLAFEKYTQLINVTDEKSLPDTLFLKSSSVNISEVAIKAHRPIVKMINNRLVYNATQLNQLKTEDNAYGTLKNIPGLLVHDDGITLVGCSKLNLMINGQVSTLSTENIISMLKSIPASRVNEVQVMYSAPAQYNVTGALVNVVLKDNQTDTPLWQGEYTLGAKQGKYFGEFGRANLMYSSPKFNVEFVYNGSNQKNKENIDFSVIHNYNNNNYFITQKMNDKKDISDHLTQVSARYITDKKDELSLTYTFNYTKGNNTGKTLSSFSVDENTPTYSLTDTKNGRNVYLHNLKLQYSSHANVKAGVDYTYYNDPSVQTFTESETSSETKFETNSGQSIHKGLFFVNATGSLSGWKFDYGVNSTFSYNKNSYSYKQLIDGNFKPDTVDIKDTKVEEFTATPFVNVTKALTEKLNLQIGIKGEYYTMKDLTDSKTKTLWDRIDAYPNLDLSYTISDKQMLQLSFNSYTTYPSYWSINPVKSYASSYTIISGNRYLIPSRTYSTQLNYIIYQKYVITGYYERTNDYLIQLPYQLSNALNLVYRNENVDNFNLAGVTFVVPFKFGSVLSSSAVVNVFRMNEKDNNFYGTSFNRSCNSFDLVLENSFTLSQKPAISFDLTGYYTYNRLQGIYDLGSTYDVSCGLKWSFDQNRASLSLKTNDLFNSNMPTSKVRFQNQHTDQKYSYDTRRVSLSFTYRFGDYKQKNKVEVDKSRFSR